MSGRGPLNICPIRLIVLYAAVHNINIGSLTEELLLFFCLILSYKYSPPRRLTFQTTTHYAYEFPRNVFMKITKDTYKFILMFVI